MQKLNATISSAINRSHILSLIHRNRESSRIQLAQLTGLGRSAITDIVQDLIQMGHVEEVGVPISARPVLGRPRVRLRVRYRHRTQAVLAVDLEEVTLLLADLSGENIRRSVFPFRRGTPLIELCSSAMALLAREEPEAFPRLAIVGVSTPGVVDATSGTVVSMSLNNWENVPLAKFMETTYGIPCLVENNAKAAALGELEGVQRLLPGRSLIYLYLRQSARGTVTSPLLIGGAMVLNGVVWHGVNSYAGEAADEIRPPFVAAVNLAREKGVEVDKISLPQFLDLANTEQAAAEAVEVLVSSVGKLLGTLATFIDPGAVLINFHPRELGTRLFPRIQASVKQNYRALATARLQVLAAPNGETAQVDGMLYLMAQELFVTDDMKISCLLRPGISKATEA